MTPGRRAYRFWLAAALSGALHAALASMLLFGTGRGGGSGRAALAVDACALICDGGPAAAATQTPGQLPLSPENSQAVPIVPTVAPPPPATSRAEPPRIVPAFAQRIAQASASKSAGSGTALGAGGPAAGGPGQGGVVTAFFQAPAKGRSVVYVVDRSGSMGLNGALDVVKRELIASLDRLPEDVRFQVIFYNRHCETLSAGGQNGLLPATAANKRLASARIDALTAEGGTDHREALGRALRLEPDAIFFLTDADDLDPETVRHVVRLNRHQTAIHTIELTAANRGRAEMPLQRLARENGGVYRAVSLRY